MRKISSIFTEKVQIPHRISELEEMVLYQQDQKVAGRSETSGRQSLARQDVSRISERLTGQKGTRPVEYAKCVLTVPSLLRVCHFMQ